MYVLVNDVLVDLSPTVAPILTLQEADVVPAMAHVSTALLVAVVPWALVVMAEDMEYMDGPVVKVAS